jgi:aspartyl protease family protein
MIGWALRWALLWGGLAFLCFALIARGGAFFSPPGASLSGGRPVSSAAAPTPAPPIASLSYPVDANGHVMVEAEIDGVPLRLLVDTGASLVSLTSKDARAVGIEPDRLSFTGRAVTANGVTPLAPVKLREIRIGQLVVENVPAAVFQNLDVSLLGMSFLSRLQSYRMGEGRFTIDW